MHQHMIRNTRSAIATQRAFAILPARAVQHGLTASFSPPSYGSPQLERFTQQDYIQQSAAMLREEEEDGERLPPHSLSQTLDSLLGSKSALTPKWADSVRVIMGSGGTPSPSTSDRGGGDRWHRLRREITKLEGELVVLRTALGVSNSHRRGALNRMLDLKGNIRVFCRVRPFLPNERRVRTGPLTTPGNDLVKVPSARKDFQFDRVFQPSSVQDDVFAEVEPIIRSALDGHNVCIFAYGQTGTGKTFTMEGTKDEPGVVPRTLQRLFDEASHDTSVVYSYSLSMLEVYKGSLRDLLVARPTRHTEAAKCLSIQMGSKGYIEVENLTEIPIVDVKEASRLYARGSRRRSTAWTNANDASSRSHCLLRINITCTSAHDNRKCISKLWLIDLGGSERLLKTNAQGLTLEEGKAINVSLSALGDVISALQRHRPHVPYRNSKLTQILRDSLGEDSKTLMLVHVSPKEDDLGETICSLSFATRARGTHLGRQISEEAEREKGAAMGELYRQMRIYEGECQLLRNSIKPVESRLKETRKMMPQEEVSSSAEQEYVAIAVDPSPSSLSPCEKPDTDSSTVSPARNVPRFMSPTASSRGKKTPGVLTPGDQAPYGKTQQPPMTFTSGHAKRIVAPRGGGDARAGMRADPASALQVNPKRKLAERAPWPASIKKSGNSNNLHISRSSMKVYAMAPTDVHSGAVSPGEEDSTDASMKLSPVHRSVGSGERLSQLLAAQRSASKLANCPSSARWATSRSRRRLSLDCGSMNGTMKRFVF